MVQDLKRKFGTGKPTCLNKMAHEKPLRVPFPAGNHLPRI